MKKFKYLIIGVLVLAILIGAYFLVASLNKEEGTPVADDVAELITVSDDSAASITDFVYTSAKGDVSFSKKTGAWAFVYDATMPVDQDHVQKIADAFLKITATREIVGGDTSAYGFDKPTLKANYITSAGDVRSLIIGAKNDMSGTYYLQFNDKVYMTDSTLVDATAYTLFDAIPMGSLEPIEADSITSLTVNGEEVPNKAGYSDITLTSVENYKNKENYGFDGSENAVTVKFNYKSDITDDKGNVTSTATVEKTYGFFYAQKDSMTYLMIPYDPCIYNVTGIDSLFTEIAKDTAA